MVEQEFTAGGWRTLLSIDGPADKDLVCEFYVNLDPRLVDGTTTTYIRGIQFNFTPSLLSTFLQIPIVHAPQHPAVGADISGEELVASTLHLNGVGTYHTNHSRLDHALMIDDYHFHNLVLSSVLAPIGHTNTISVCRGHMLYAIGTDLITLFSDSIIRIMSLIAMTTGWGDHQQQLAEDIDGLYSTDEDADPLADPMEDIQSDAGHGGHPDA
ncbi:hypothetical protein F0562_017876 [Nyssa sinensis]|uniref:Putative plant transposon protein domain-containing protein n=1 Tax=Nyssa sinensis TaxID=561372 RepID=A0A5J4ZHX6_9ASTE|nr:hypothetical protein F0562_017876 [Nyssa sinensis]